MTPEFPTALGSIFVISIEALLIYQSLIEIRKTLLINLNLNNLVKSMNIGYKFSLLLNENRKNSKD